MKPRKTLQLAAALTLLAASANAQYFSGMDLGGPTYPGSVVTNGDGSLTVSGGGGDIWGNSDQCYYYFTWASGQQWEAKVDLYSLTGPDWWTKAELMVRWSDPNIGPQANDAFIAAMATQPPEGSYQNSVADQFRSTRGGGAAGVDLSPKWQPTYPNQWLRLTRTNSVFGVYFGPDGVNWTNYLTIDTASTASVGGSTFGTPWPDALTVGLAVTAHNNSSSLLGVGTFANLQVSFPPVQSPTVIGAATQVQNVANYAGSEASFTFVTTNNAQPAVVTWPNYVSYQWYKNGTAIANATSTSYTHLINPSDATENGAQYYCQATVLPPFNGTVSGLTSATGTVSVVPGALYYTNGLKLEYWAGATRQQVENGNVPGGNLSFVPNLDIPADGIANYARRVTGWFIPPVTTNYVFFVAADDDTDVFLSTDGSDPSHKQLICQENGWSPYRNYTNIGGGSIISQKRSDQWTNDLGAMPFSSGISLTAGQPYYLEAVHHEGAPDDDLSVTYVYFDPAGTVGPSNGTPSMLQGTNNNIVLITSPTTNLVWTLTPTNITVTEGLSGVLYAKAHSDTELAPLYQWYRNSNPIANATTTAFNTGSVTPANNGDQIFVVANTAEGGYSITSSVVTLTVASPILEPGRAYVEFWASANRAAVEAGTAGVPTYTTTAPGFEAGLNGESGDGYARRVSGFFIPPATDDYVFFVCSDDDSDLFLSTDNTTANKRLIAQEFGWTDGPLTWLRANIWDGTLNQTVQPAWALAQTRSDQWTNGTGATPYATGIRLTGGTRYYIEAVHHDGSGGDSFAATYKRLHTLDTGVPDPDPISGQDSRLRGNVIAMFATRCTSVTVTQQPVNVTVAPVAAGAITFSAGGTTDSQTPVGVVGDPRPLVSSPVYLAFQWQKNGVDLPGATASTFSYYGPILPSDDGAVFTCKLRALGYADNSLNPIWVTSSPATLTVTPKIQLVTEPGLTVVQHWDGKNRTDVETGNVGNPAWTSTSPEFEVSTNNESGDNYARRLSGFFIPPATDDYVFWVTSDDNADLFLSSDASPLSKRLVARNNDWANQFLWNTGNGVLANKRSDRFSDWASGLNNGFGGIHLIAGQKYYMEAVHYEGGGGDNVEVTYSTMTGATPVDGEDTMLKGTVISTLVPASHVAITNQSQSVTLPNYSPLVLTVGATTDSQISFGQPGDIRNYLNNFLKYQWYKNSNLIAGATTSRYTESAALPSDNGAQFYCAVRSVGLGDAAGNPIWSNSAPITMTITTNAPHLLYSAFYVNSNWVAFTGYPTNYVTLFFDSPMDPGLLSQASSYTLGCGLAIQSVTVSSNDYKSVALEVLGTPTLPCSISINAGVKGLGGGLPVANTSIAVKPTTLICQDIGQPQLDPTVPGMMYMANSNAVMIACEGSDIWNNADGFNFTYEIKTNDFDVVVRQKDIKHTSNWAKGGLMVRETLDAASRNWNIVNDPLSSDGIMAPDNSGYGANAIECNARVSTGGASGGWAFVGGAAPAYPNAWVRLTRVGGLLSAYWSTNGLTWTLAATNTPASVGDMTVLPAAVYVGICTTAHNNDPFGTPMDQLRFLNIVNYADYNSSYVYVPPVTLTASVSGKNITITWTPNVGHLLSSPAVSGPGVNWQAVPGGTGGSVTLPVTATPTFFRVVNP